VETQTVPLSDPDHEARPEDAAEFFSNHLLGLGIGGCPVSPGERQLVDNFAEVILVNSRGRWLCARFAVEKLHRWIWIELGGTIVPLLG
jgi:hypothetical protein